MNTYGIIGAMPSELAGIQSAQKDTKTQEIAGYTFCESIHGSSRIVTVCCGIGKVNAAVCTQLLIDRFGVDAVINTGIAGGMHREIKVLEIVISTEVLPHDLDQHFLKDYPPYCGIYPADKALQDRAQAVCEAKDIHTWHGRIVSGDAFITDSAVKAKIQEAFDPMAVDMETAAIGQTAWRNKVPFVSIRCISDLADDDGAMSFDEFEHLAAQRVGEIVMDMVFRG